MDYGTPAARAAGFRERGQLVPPCPTLLCTDVGGTVDIVPRY